MQVETKELDWMLKNVSYFSKPFITKDTFRFYKKKLYLYSFIQLEVKRLSH